MRDCIMLYDTRLLSNCYDLVMYVYSRRDRAMMYDARPLVENSRLEILGGGVTPAPTVRSTVRSSHVSAVAATGCTLPTGGQVRVV